MAAELGKIRERLERTINGKRSVGVSARGAHCAPGFSFVTRCVGYGLADEEGQRGKDFS